MRKKWIIIAMAVFLAALVFLTVMYMRKQRGYPYDAVVSELSEHNAYSAPRVTESRILMPVFKSRPDPFGFRKLISWYNYNFRYARYTQIISPPSTIFFSSNGSDYMNILVSVEDDRIIEVEIVPLSGVVQDAVDIQSKLSKAFPELPCKITGNVESAVSE